MEDPTKTTAYRVAKAAVIILGILIAIAFVALIVGFIYRLTHNSNAPQAMEGTPLMYQLKTGAKIVDMKADAGHVILRIRTDQGEEIEIIDDASGRVVTRIVAPAK
jgi:hypothetical protein